MQQTLQTSICLWLSQQWKKRLRAWEIPDTINGAFLWAETMQNTAADMSGA